MRNLVNAGILIAFSVLFYLSGCTQDSESTSVKEPVPEAGEVAPTIEDDNQGRSASQTEPTVGEAKRCGPDPVLLEKKLKTQQEEQELNAAIRDEGIAGRETDLRDAGEIEKLRQRFSKCREDSQANDVSCEAFVFGDPAVCTPIKSESVRKGCVDQAMLAKAHKENDIALCDKIHQSDGREICRWVLGKRPECGAKTDALLNQACHQLKGRKSKGCCDDKCKGKPFCAVVSFADSLRRESGEGCDGIPAGLLAKSCRAFHAKDKGLCGQVAPDPTSCRYIAWGAQYEASGEAGESGTISARVHNIYSETGRCVLVFSSPDPERGVAQSNPFELVSGEKTKTVTVAAGTVWSTGELSVKSECEWDNNTAKKVEK